MADDPPNESPGYKPMGLSGTLAVAAYLILVTFLIIHALTVLWPPYRPANEDKTQQNEERERGEDSTTESGATDLSPDTSLTSDTPASELESTEPMTTAGDTGETEEQDSSPDGAGSTGAASNLCGPPQEGQERADLFWGLIKDLCLSEEERLFLIVLLAGMLGGLAHAIPSFFWYVGNRKLVRSWSAMYVFLPIQGAVLALIFYLVIRGGFFSPVSKIEDTSPFGFAALATLVGMFSRQASEKLKEIAGVVFKEPAQGKDTALPAPKIDKIEPATGPVAGGTEVKITGANFDKDTKVLFGAKPADKFVFTDEKTISAWSPAASAPGPVVLTVTNSNQKKATSSFTYT